VTSAVVLCVGHSATLVTMMEPNAATMMAPSDTPANKMLLLATGNLFSVNFDWMVKYRETPMGTNVKDYFGRRQSAMWHTNDEKGDC
jgi:hypothetical protein